MIRPTRFPLSRLRPRAVAVSVAGVVALTTGAVGAGTAGAVTLGAGDPVRIPAAESEVTDAGIHTATGLCTAGIPGTVTDPDGTTHRVMITAGHCAASPFEDITGEFHVPTPEGDRHVGTARDVRALGFVDGDPANGLETAEDDAAAVDEDDPVAFLDQAFNMPDYAVVAVDDDVEMNGSTYSVDSEGRRYGSPIPLTRVRDYPDLDQRQVSLDNLGQPVCKDGNRTGRSCGFQLFRTANGVWSVNVRLSQGDSGGPAYDPKTGEVVGVSSQAIGPFQRYQPLDVPVERVYGAPDGQAADTFRIAPATGEHDTFRTMDDDIIALMTWYDEHEPAADEPEAGDPTSSAPDAFPAPELPQLPELPQVPQVQAPQLPQLPQVPQVQAPQLPELPELPQLPQLPQLGAQAGAADQVGTPEVQEPAPTTSAGSSDAVAADLLAAGDTARQAVNDGIRTAAAAVAPGVEVPDVV
ncbi:hypothetical protein [Corynebacterium bovis]|uniref:hypothetical protein n=1 Tax=Corynebacterium bovis TaxID=36808 RepID=UPI0030800F00